MVLYIECIALLKHQLCIFGEENISNIFIPADRFFKCLIWIIFNVINVLSLNLGLSSLVWHLEA